MPVVKGTVKLGPEAEPLLEKIRQDPTKAVAELVLANHHTVRSVEALYHKQDRIEKILKALIASLAKRGALTSEDCEAITLAVMGSELKEELSGSEEGNSSGHEGERDGGEPEVSVEGQEDGQPDEKTGGPPHGEGDRP